MMQLGGNDFSGDDVADHTEVANKLIQLAKDLRQGHAGVVVIGNLCIGRPAAFANRGSSR